jgi:hypothetical protein
VKEKPAEKIRCPLCGRSFSREEQGCGGKCGLLGNCGLICCPGCGYSFVAEPRTVQMVKNLFRRKNEKEPKP